MSALPTEAPVSTRIVLPPALYAAFEARAFLAGRTAEELIVEHLAATREYTSSAPIYIDDRHAAEIRRLLGGRVNTPDKLLMMIERLTRLKVGGKQVEISPERQEAMVWLARSMQLSLEDALPRIYDQALGMLLKC